MKTTITWNHFEFGCKRLAELIKASGKKYSMIYAIPRGGLCIGVRLSHLLNIPFNTVNSEDVAIGRNCLIVDDIQDTGKTLKTFHELGCDIATFHYHKQSGKPPTYYLWEKTDRWIEYPWEMIWWTDG